MRIAKLGIATVTVCGVVGFLGCGGDDNDNGPSENAGSACSAPTDCYPDVKDPKTIKGEITCLDKVPGGYCTHFCTADTDCCAVPNECKSGHPQVCSPFENTGQMYCFLSCEDADWQGAGSPDADSYCHDFANTGFTCRSTGGGAANRKVCAA
jgi:hypothetical protein